jgi:hypothetical protein
MKRGMRLVALFVAYGAIAAGGDYVVGLIAQEAPSRDREGDYEISVQPRVDVSVDREASVAVLVRNAGDCEYEVDRELSVELSGASLLSVEVGAGSLRVEGRAGIDEVRAVGHVCASDQRFLDDLTLSVERDGSEIILSAHYPEHANWRGNRTARIDLVVEMPLGMAVDVDDSSGSLEVAGSGDLRIQDSSGSIRVRGVDGALFIEDSSGGIEVEDVSGDVEIRDGSGGIDIREIDGSVRLEDGSGGIDVSRVGGDFTVARDGSGGIRHSGVEGRVEIPARKKRRRRGN